MTANQLRAVALARGLLGGTVDAAALPDADWHLLLLAAGLNGRRRAPAALVAEQVLLLAEHQDGYFARGDGPAERYDDDNSLGADAPAGPDEAGGPAPGMHAAGQ